ncbi:MAG: tRNA (adenosine(37)-N6)-threonylcarbamoyltransferase complex dimerization subunit type 1 TsaB [Terriglobia bacterium]
MLILAFDTTSEIGGVGIFRDAECVALVPNDGPANRYSVTLFEMLERALAQARLELREIDLYAAANGPGSFTGIRVGLAAARAWGKAFNRRVRGVSVLEAMVNKVRLTSDLAFPILDARRGEFFLGVFRKTTHVGASGAGPEAERCSALHADGGWVLKPESLREFVEKRLARGESATCLVRAHDQAAAGLRSILSSSLNWHHVEGTLVDSIADTARKEELASCPSSAANLDAYYIRRPDAEVNWKD